MPAVVIESRLEMDLGRELLSCQQRLKPLFAECARYGTITSLQLPLSKQPTHIVQPRPRTAPVMRPQLVSQQKRDEENGIVEAVGVVEKQEVEQQPLRGIRHLQALRKSVSFENNEGQQRLMEEGEEHVPGSQWSVLLDSESLLLTASFNQLTTNPNASVATSSKPLKQELGDELSQMYESLFSRRDQLLAAQEQEELDHVEEDELDVLPDSCDHKNWESGCSDRSSISGVGSLLQQDESQPNTHRSHRTSLQSNMSYSNTAAETPFHVEAELLVEPLPQPHEDEPEEVDSSLLALTYSQLDPSTYQLLLQPYFPNGDTHLISIAEDPAISGELVDNSWFSVPRLPASSECSSRLGRAWQLKNLQRSASVCSELSAPLVAGGFPILYSL